MIDHVGGNVESDHVVTAVSEETAGPTRATTHVQKPCRRHRQQGHDRPDFHQIGAATSVGKWLVLGVPYLGLTQVAQIVDLALFAHGFHPWRWPRRRSALHDLSETERTVLMAY